MTELELTSSQLLGLFNRVIRRMTKYLFDVLGKAIEEKFEITDVPELQPLTETIDQDLEKTEKVRCNICIRYSGRRCQAERNLLFFLIGIFTPNLGK